MTETLSRAEALRNDLDNLHFTKRYLIGVLAELEDLGRTNTADFRRTEANLRAVNNNIRRLEAELEAEESAWIEAELDKIDANELVELW